MEANSVRWVPSDKSPDVASAQEAARRSGLLLRSPHHNPHRRLVVRHRHGARDSGSGPQIRGRDTVPALFFPQWVLR